MQIDFNTLLDEPKKAIRQALFMGKLKIEEYRRIEESAVGVIDCLMHDLVVTREELLDLVKSSGIPVETLVRPFANSWESLANTVNRLAPGLQVVPGYPDLSNWPFLIELAKAADIPASPPAGYERYYSGDAPFYVTLPDSSKWKVVVFYDVGDMDYIDRFISPTGAVIDFWEWPEGTPGRDELMAL